MQFPPLVSGEHPRSIPGDLTASRSPSPHAVSFPGGLSWAMHCTGHL